jgi:hypothetical protein
VGVGLQRSHEFGTVCPTCCKIAQLAQGDQLVLLPLKRTVPSDARSAPAASSGPVRSEDLLRPPGFLPGMQIMNKAERGSIQQYGASLSPRNMQDSRGCTVRVPAAAPPKAPLPLMTTGRPCHVCGNSLEGVATSTCTSCGRQVCAGPRNDCMRRLGSSSSASAAPPRGNRCRLCPEEDQLPPPRTPRVVSDEPAPLAVSKTSSLACHRMRQRPRRLLQVCDASRPDHPRVSCIASCRRKETRNVQVINLRQVLTASARRRRRPSVIAEQRQALLLVRAKAKSAHAHMSLMLTWLRSVSPICY